MDQSLRELFDRALDDEPLPPAGDLAREAMAGGRRRRRRRHLAVCGAAAGVVAAFAAVVGVNATSSEPTTHAAMSVVTRPGCARVATEVAVFLDADITDAQRTALELGLRSDPRVGQVRYESREEAYENFKRMYRDAPDLIAAVRPGQLPEAFRVEVAAGAERRALQKDLESRPGVEVVAGGVCAAVRGNGEGE